MIIYKADVFCDHCMDWTDGGETQHDTSVGMALHARVWAKVDGWVTVRSPGGKHQDICPECQAKGLTNIPAR